MNCKSFTKKEVIIYSLLVLGWVYEDGRVRKVRR